jgi:hypothetical protein
MTASDFSDNRRLIDPGFDFPIPNKPIEGNIDEQLDREIYYKAYDARN